MENKIILSTIPASVFILSVYGGEHVKLKEEYKKISLNIAIGVLIALLSTELIPMIFETKGKQHRIFSILGIIIAVIFLNITSSHNDSKKIKRLKRLKNDTLLSIRKYLPLFIGLLLDGFIIGIQKTNKLTAFSIILAIALSIDNLFVGVAIGEESELSNHKMLMVGILLGSAVVLGALIGSYSLMYLNGKPELSGLIAFGVTALMWETFQELTPEAYPLSKKDSSIGMYFGFITVIIISWLFS